MGAIHTRDLEEATSAVANIYCSHELQLKRTERALDTSLRVSGPQKQPIVRLRYGAAVSVDAGHFPRLFLVMACTAGRGLVVQRGRRQIWSAGTTIPVSAGLATRFEFERDFAQTSVRLDLDLMEKVCAAWLGHPITQGIRFELAPFSPDLQRSWDQVLAFTEGLTQLPPAAAASFEEFALTLLLHGHPHNYSEEMRDPAPSVAAGLVKRAERYIEEHAGEAITVSDVAAHVNTSLRSLQAGFKNFRDVTPGGFLRDVRLKRVHAELLEPTDTTTVTEVAHRWGFIHLGRFSRIYRLTFNESPSVTLSRGLSYRR